MTDGPDRYPIRNRRSDPRFSHGLVNDVATVLTSYGYPRPAWGDLARLQALLVRFLHGDRGADR